MSVDIMRKRSRTPLYLIYSLCIHFLLLLVIWWTVPEQVPTLPFHGKIEALITHIERPPLPPKPPVVEPAVLVVVEEETKPPPPPKPKAGLNASWQTVNRDAADLPKPETRKQEGCFQSHGSCDTYIRNGVCRTTRRNKTYCFRHE